jgi:TDG/mug DNA glycosylase family protein
MHVRSFPPISEVNSRTLVLGSMPGKASLAAHQYYAHPRNHFWRIVGHIFSFPLEWAYEARCEALTGNGVALWDVLKLCTRKSSLDSDIVGASMVVNDFAKFMGEHPSIEAIYFNGAMAETIYLQRVKPGLPPGLAGMPAFRLPSTSPANASIPFAEKLNRWQAIAETRWSSGRRSADRRTPRVDRR